MKVRLYSASIIINQYTLKNINYKLQTIAPSDTAIVAIVFHVLWFTTGLIMLVGGTFYVYTKKSDGKSI